MVNIIDWFFDKSSSYLIELVVLIKILVSCWTLNRSNVSSNSFELF